MAPDPTSLTPQALKAPWVDTPGDTEGLIKENGTSHAVEDISSGSSISQEKLGEYSAITSSTPAPMSQGKREFFSSNPQSPNAYREAEGILREGRMLDL